MTASSTAKDLKRRKPETEHEQIVRRAWRRFKRKFPSDEACLSAITEKLVAVEKFVCPSCGERNWGTVTGRSVSCLSCGGPTSVTAGTFFDHMRVARAWLAAMWFAEQGVVVNALTFHRLLRIAQSTARSILKRIWTALQVHMQEGSIAVPSACLIELFCRRSFETPARKSPKEEEDASCDTSCSDGQVQSSSITDQSGACDRPGDMDKIVPSDSSDSEPEQRSCDQLSSGAEVLILQALCQIPLCLDELCNRTKLPAADAGAALSMLELSGLCKRLPGGRYTDARSTFNRIQGTAVRLDQRSEAIVKNTIGFLRSIFQGHSRKYLPLYLVADWIHRTRPAPRQIAVVDACIQHGKLSAKDIFNTTALSIARVSAATSSTR